MYLFSVKWIVKNSAVAELPFRELFREKDLNSTFKMVKDGRICFRETYLSRSFNYIIAGTELWSQTTLAYKLNLYISGDREDFTGE